MLPKLTMAYLFVVAVEIVNEAYVAATRVDTFLKIPEPGRTNVMDGSVVGEVKLEHGNFSWYVQRTQTKTNAKKEAIRVFSKVNASRFCF